MFDVVAADWWGLMKPRLEALTGHRQYVLQARGTYKGSGGTHEDGACIDLRTYHMSARQVEDAVRLMRLYGGVAWYRRNVGSGPHIHVAVNLKRAHAASYQVRAAKRGRDGLARNGRDPHPAPPEWITAEEGIRRMKAEGKKDEGILAGMGADEVYKLVQKAIAELNWGGEKFGPYLGRLQQNAAAAAQNARQAAVNTADVHRPGDPKADARGDKPLRQETADALSEVRKLAAEVDKLRADVAGVLAAVNTLAGLKG